MNSYTNKIQENKNSIAQKKQSDTVSNHQETTLKTKLQNTANDSEQVKKALQLQAIANSSLPIQKKGIEEEELQMKAAPIQKQGIEEEELQMKAIAIQKKGIEEEEPLQGKFTLPVQKKENKTGLPNDLKSGIENLSGYAMDDVKVHYNSDKPAELQAHAYAQGNDIHIASGQEKHLPHEAWHVVQQAQGRVKPTMQMQGGVPVNDDAGLEHEADLMGAKAQAGAVQLQANGKKKILTLSALNAAQRYTPVVQRIDSSDVKQGVKNACKTLWDLIKGAHTTKSAPFILNGLSLLATAVRFAKSDNSIAAQTGSGLITLVLAIDSTVSAVEEWRDANGEGKDLWKKRVDALEKLTTTLITAAALFALPFNPIIGGAIGGIGIGAVKTLRSGYDLLAHNWLFKSNSNQSQESSQLI